MSLPSGPADKRRLKEMDIDPAGELTSDRAGETENAGDSRQGSNQPAENREDPTRSDNRQTENRDNENAPNPGHEE